MKAIAPSFRRNLLFQVLVLVTLTPGLVLYPVRVNANPQGANVVAGNVNFQGMGSARLDINNLSQRAIINWQSFSIQKGELTNINQGRNAFTMNRVVSGNPTDIYGTLRASNGGVAVINPNGIVVHGGGTVDVAGMLTMSTLDTSDKDFLNGGRDRYRGTTSAGVVNYGAISSSGGDVVLLGNFLQNAGSVSAPAGTVAFGAGGDIIVDQAGGAKISVQAGGKGGAVGIENTGEINAAAAELKAHGNVYALAIKNDGLVRASGYNFSGGRLTLSAGSQGRIVNTGNLVARNSDGSGGQIQISGGDVELGSGGAGRGQVDASGAAGMAGGDVQVSGTNVTLAQGASVKVGGSTGGSAAISGTGTTLINGTVDATGSEALGGSIKVEGRNITVGNTASVDASGDTGGGNVQIGGGFQGKDATIRNAESLRVDDGARIAVAAVGNGRGGNVILWSDGDTFFDGEVKANGVTGGGFVEVSGKQGLAFDGEVDLTASNGKAGTLLLDPTDITISAAVASTNNVNNVSLSTLLDQGVNVIITSNFGAAGPAGSITINDRVEWYQENAVTTPGSLTLLAVGDISFNRSVRSAGTGAINVVAGWDGSTGLINPLSGSAQTDGVAFDMAAVLATMNDGNVGNDGAGLNGGSVFVNSATGSQFVEVGSRYGATNIASHDLFVTASNTVGDDRWAHIGFHDNGYEWELGRTILGITKNEWWGNAASNVRGKNYIADLGGTVLNGGQFKGAGYGATGAIEIGLSGRLDMRAADNRNRNYVQIGHGGTNDAESQRSAGAPTRTTREGFVFDTGDDNRVFFGASWRTNYLGHAARVNAPIKVTAAEDVFVSAARDFEAGFEDLVTPDTGGGDYALIGHGGYRQAASLHGDITVIAHGVTPQGAGRGLAGAGIQLRGNGGSGGFAQIGHGTASNFNRRTIWDQQKSGSVTVTATTGAVRLIGFNQLPRQGAAAERNTGNILDANTPLGINSPMDPSTLFSHVQIGHGGSAENEPATGGQFIQANVAGVPVLYDPFNNTFANPGTNVNTRLPEQSLSGNINVFAGGTVRVRDIMGYDENGVWVEDPGPGVDPYLFPGGGAIFRDIGIEVRAANMYFGHGMIGHGGQSIRAIDALSTGHTGDISVVADKGGILFVGGEEKRADRSWGFGYNFVQVGHGGRNVLGPKSGNITVTAGQGAGAIAGDIMFRSGRMRQSWAQIGHGGQDITREIVGDGLSDITVTAKGNLEFTSRISGPSDITLSPDYVDWALGENGSGSAGNSEWTERVVGTLASGNQIPQSAVQSQNWDTNIKYAMIGHGGSSVNYTGAFSLNNEIDVTAQEGNIRFTAGGGDRDFAQIGHGGYRTGGTPNIIGANIDVAAAGDVIVDASSAGTIMVERTSMVGLVTRDGGGNFVSSGQRNAIGRGFAAFGMIGNGGYDFDGDHSGEINVTAGGDFMMIGPKTPAINSVSGYTAGFVESASTFPASGTQNYWIGTPHALNTLQEASSMSRSFQLYHGGAGASEPEHKGNINPGSVVIDIGSTGGVDLRDAPNGDGTGTLYRSAAAIGGNYAVGTHGAAYGTIDYATGRVTMNTAGVTANNGDLENDRNQLNRNIDYTYAHPTLGNVVINDERTPESDTALRPNEAFVGHGRILPGTFSLNVGGTIYTDSAINGEIRSATNTVVGNIDYDTGRVRFRSVVNPGGTLAVTADYQWAEGNKDESFVQLGNGGRASAVGGRDSIGHTGSINLNAGGDVRFHAGSANNTYALLGNGGTSTQGASSGDIVINAGGILEFMAGTPIHYTKGNQYAQLGHGGYDADGSHLGNISITGGSGAMSLASGTIGGGANAGLVFRAGGGLDTYALLGHGGRSSQAGLLTQVGLAPDQAGRLTGNITASVAGAIQVIAGTKIAHPTNNIQNNDDGRSFAQIGHGGWDGDINAGTYVLGTGHLGDISVTTTTGDVNVIAGDTALGSAGADFGRFHWAQIGHGGFSSSGDHHGNITVSTGEGSVAIRGGAPTTDVDADKYNVARVGHANDTVNGKLGLAGEFIKVYALGGSGNVIIDAGDGRRSGAQIGNGGYLSPGDHYADIKIIAANNLTLNSGATTGLDNWGKIGNGDQRNRGGGAWDGDIHISVGETLSMGMGVIGHIDTKLSSSSVSGLTDGDTFIAVGRNHPTSGGTGNFFTTSDSVISSAAGGILGDQLRIYMPDASSNGIAAGTFFNGAGYVRTPAPGTNRADEQFAVEHMFPESGLTEADATFTPEGDYPFHSFGLYNIYYGGEAPPVPPTPPIPPTPPVPPTPGFDFNPFVFSDTYDAFFRSEEMFLYDGYDEVLPSVAYADAMESEAPVATGGTFLEEILDDSFGERQYGDLEPGSSILEDEDDEERNRRKRRAAQQVGRGGLSYYVYDPGTNRYSSYRVFGVEQTRLSVTQ
jgi:filamentous hemagglutinin family protein